MCTHFRSIVDQAISMILLIIIHNLFNRNMNVSIGLIALFLTSAQAFTPFNHHFVRNVNSIVDAKPYHSVLSMFTGIVEEMGTVVKLEERDDMVLWDGSKGKGTELTVKGNVVMDGAYLG